MDRVRIEIADNGYVMSYEDDKIEAANRKPGAKWKDSEVKRVYATQAALVQDLASVLPKMKSNEPDPKDEDTSSFNEAFKSE